MMNDVFFFLGIPLACYTVYITVAVYLDKKAKKRNEELAMAREYGRAEGRAERN
jgi:hypothetical protein